MKTETGAEIAKLSGKFDRLQREVTAKLADRLITRTTLCAVKAPRGDAFDPCQIPVPRALLAPLEALLSRKGQGSAAKLLKRASERA